MLLNKFYLLFSIELVPCLDASGPTLAVNVLHEPGYKLLLSMLRKEVASPLPRLDALAMEDTGIIYCEYLFLFVHIYVTTIHSLLHQIHVHFSALTHIPIRLHISDLVVLNKNQDATAYMLTLLRLLCTDRYSAVFALNRCLYRKFFFI